MGNVDAAKTRYQQLNPLTELNITNMAHLRAKMARAMLLKQEQRYHATLEAIDLLDEVISTPTERETDLMVIALKYRFEFYIEELQHYENMEILLDIKEVIDKLRRLGEQQNSVITILETGLLEA